MQDQQFSFVINACKEDVWAALWSQESGDVTEHGKLRVEILHGGDDTGNGLVRHRQFPTPRYLLSGGKAQSWEWVTELKLNDSWRYDGISRPLWSRISGWTRLEALEDNRTRIHCRETYHVVNPIMRFFLEKAVYRAISKGNLRKMRVVIEHGLRSGAHKSNKQARSKALAAA